MRKVSLFAFVLSIVILTTACGPDRAAPAHEATPTSPSAPTTTSEEVSAPAGEPGDMQLIEITAKATGYNPSGIKVKAGSQVRFIITNIDESDDHDLWNKRAKIDVQIRAGQTVTYDWVAPQVKDTYIAECTLHEGLTMRIIVE